MNSIVLGIIICLVVLMVLFTYAMCKAASIEDSQLEEIYKLRESTDE